jgi:hypothetical protein
MAFAETTCTLTRRLFNDKTTVELSQPSPPRQLWSQVGKLSE